MSENKQLLSEAVLRAHAVPFVPNDKVRIFNLVAPTGQGKTFFVNRYLQKECAHYDFIYVFSPTSMIKDDLFEGVPEHIMKVVHKIPDVTDENVIKIFDSAFEASQALHDYPNEKLAVPDVLVIFDDCLDSGVLRMNGPCDRMVERGRQVKVQQIYTSQGVKRHSNRIRDNSTYSMLWSPDSVAQMEKFLFEFVPKSLRKDIFPLLESVFRIEHAFIFIDNTESQPLYKLKWSTTQDLLDRRQAFLFPFAHAGDKTLEGTKATRRKRSLPKEDVPSKKPHHE